MNVVERQPCPCLCLEQWQTTSPTVEKVSLLLFNEISGEGFHFLQLFKRLLVSLTSMSTADHDLGIGKVVFHCLIRGEVGVLLLNGNFYSFVLCFFECKACSIAFGTLGGSLVELLFNYVIPTFLMEMLAVKKSSIVLVLNAKSSILAETTTCHPCAISGRDCMTPQTKFTLVHASHVVLCIITHFINHILHNWVHWSTERLANRFNSQCMLQCFIIRHMDATSNYKSHLCSNANFCSITKFLLRCFK